MLPINHGREERIDSYWFLRTDVRIYQSPHKATLLQGKANLPSEVELECHTLSITILDTKLLQGPNHALGGCGPM